jgi:phosphoribosylglycinamide formyltransferase-1
VKFHIGVLASGSGTTTEAFIRAGQSGQIETGVELVICNNASAGIFDRIKRLNKEFGLHIRCELINGISHPALHDEVVPKGTQTKAEEAAILSALQAQPLDAVVQMGYLKRTGPDIVEQFGWQPQYRSNFQTKLLNTHPGLLPITEGLYGIFVQQYVIEHQLPFGGQTLHLVAEKYDDGPTLAEYKVKVMRSDTAESLFERVQEVEKLHVPLDVQNFISGKEAYNKQFKGE